MDGSFKDDIELARIILDSWESFLRKNYPEKNYSARLEEGSPYLPHYHGLPSYVRKDLDKLRVDLILKHKGLRENCEKPNPEEDNDA